MMGSLLYEVLIIVFVFLSREPCGTFMQRKMLTRSEIVFVWWVTILDSVSACVKADQLATYKEWMT